MVLAGKWRLFLLGAACVACIYPVALIPILILDQLVGEAEFLRFVMAADVAEAIGLIVGDWWAAFPAALVFWLIARAAVRLIGIGYFQLLSSVLVFCGSILGIRAPYLPMIFPSMLLAVVLLNIPYERCRASG